MTTIPTPTAEPGSPGSVQEGLELINRAQKKARNSLFLAIGLCVPFGISTAITAQTVLLDFTASLFLAWLLTFAVAMSANFASYYAGSMWHRARASSVAVGAAWFLVGAVLVYLRLNHADLAPPAAELGLSREASSEHTALAGVRDQAQAAILGTLYLLGGLVAALKGYTISHPEALTHLTTVEAEKDTATQPVGH